MQRLLGVMTLLLALGAAQAETPKTPATAPAAPSTAEAGGLSWTAPAGWASQGERPMRAATYLIPSPKPNVDPAELAVFYFGAGQGGAVDANVKRWLGQFQKADGSAVTEKEAKTKKEQINGLAVTTVEVKGTYAGGGPMMGPSTPHTGWRLLGAIVEAPEGPVFFKLTGPEQTVAGAEKNFRKLLESVKKK